MEWTTDQVQAEIRQRVREASEQLRKELRVREVWMKRAGHLDVVPILRVIATRDGVIIEVAE